MLVFAAWLVTTFTGLYAGSDSRTVITQALQEQMSVSAPSGMIRVNINLNEQFDSQLLIREVQGMSRDERRAYVVDVLKQFSALAQQGLLADLNRLQREGKATQCTTIWIANVVNCYVTPDAIEQLAMRTDIALIDYDEVRVLIDPRESDNIVLEDGMQGSREITWNVIKINADDVWALGYNGDGIVVSVIDTGVNFNHVDLADHVWTDPDYPNHGYDFVNNDNNPMDDHGHGTHCAGTVAGDGTAGSQTGMAPEATIMCCKVLDAGGSGTESGVWSAVQFSVENGADVMSLSLGWQHAWGPNRSAWRTAFDNSMAAGVLASVAAGNEGDEQGSYPIPDNVRTPGDLPPAWLHPDQTLTGGVSGIVCVGATDSNDGLAGFSSRGPCDWSAISPFNDYPYQPEMGLIRPDICAPGVNIKSLDYSSNTGYASGWSGTSMATPANAGMIALMLQKNNLLSPEDINQIIEETTVVLTAGKNNNSGSGRIDALAAVNATPAPGPSYNAHLFNDATGNNNHVMSPGEHILLNLSVANFSEVAVTNITVTLSTTSPDIVFTDNTEFYGTIAVNQIKEMIGAYAFDVAADITDGESIEFILTASDGTESWESSFVAVPEGLNLVLGEFTIADYAGNNNFKLDPGETVDILIETSNFGQMDATDVLATLSSPSSEITITAGEYPFGTLASGQTLTAIFTLTVSPDAPIGSVVELNYNVVSGGYILSEQYFRAVGLILEDFETGDFSLFDWQTAGDQAWTITGDEKFEGDFSARSGVIGNSQTSELSLTLVVADEDSVSYFRKVSSQANADYLRFFVDEVLWDETSGETGWIRAAAPVSEGLHTFRWVYLKNQNTTSGSDCAWVDYIDLPPSVGQVTVNAGADDAVCQSVGFQTVATASNYETVLWETSGFGTFDHPDQLDAIYFPYQEDYDAGSAVLSLTVYGPANQVITDQLTLSYLPFPGLVGPITGQSIVCMDGENTYSIDPVTDADYYFWSVDPAEAGTLVGEGTEITVQWAAGWLGQASLKAYGVNECGGGGNVQDLIIQVDDCTGIDDLSSSLFTLAPNPGNGQISLHFGLYHPEGMRLTILNLTGEKMFETQLTGPQNQTLDLSWLRKGIYFMLVDDGKTTLSRKLLIQ